jgi:hypothetical protein
MNGDELRRIALSQPELQRQLQIAEAAETAKRNLEKEWVAARKAVAELETTVRKAASEGKFSAIVYKAHSQCDYGLYWALCRTSREQLAAARPDSQKARSSQRSIQK